MQIKQEKTHILTFGLALFLSATVAKASEAVIPQGKITEHQSLSGESSTQLKLKIGEPFAFKYQWRRFEPSPNKAKDKYESRSSDALLIEAIGEKKCAKSIYALSTKELKFDQADQFCEGLNTGLHPAGEAAKKASGTKKWILADFNAAGTLKESCKSEDALLLEMANSAAFPTKAKKNYLGVWVQSPSIPREYFPYSVTEYALKLTDPIREMDPVSRRPIIPRERPVLCVLAP